MKEEKIAHVEIKKISTEHNKKVSATINQFTYHTNTAAMCNQKYKRLKIAKVSLVALSPIVALIPVLPEWVRLFIIGLMTAIAGIIEAYLTIYDLKALGAEYRNYAEDLRELITVGLPEDEDSYERFIKKYKALSREHRSVYNRIKQETDDDKV